MNLEKKDYHSLVYTFDNLDSINLLIGYLPKSFVLDGEADQSEDKSSIVYKFNYYSPVPYTLSPNANELQVDWNGKKYYKLRLFLIEHELGGKKYLVLSVPFTSMLRNIVNVMERAVKIRNIQYMTLKIDDVVSAIKKGSKKGDTLSCCYLEATIFGDVNCKKTAMLGVDVVNSDLYSELSGLPFKTILKKVKLRYETESGVSFSLLTDLFGNFRHYVGVNGSNLINSKDMIHYLYDNNFYELTDNFPPDRGKPTKIDDELGVD